MKLRRYCSGLLTLSLGWLGAGAATAQAPAWQTAVAPSSIGTTADERSYALATATDAAGNAYLAGWFTGTVRFGSVVLTSTGQSDAFVAKWSSGSGDFVWARQVGGPGYEQATAIAVSGGSVYVAGTFSSPMASLGTTTLTNQTTGSSATSLAGDGFVAKLTDAGSTASFTWAQQVSGPADEWPAALAVSGASVYVAGHFNSPAAQLGASTLVSAGLNDAFVAKITDAGATSSFAWAQRVGGSGQEQATAVAANGQSVYLTGAFASSTVSLGSTTLTQTANSDVFIAKLTDVGTAGIFGWARQTSGTDFNYGAALAVSGSAVYVAGSFQSTMLHFGTLTVSNASSNYDLFVAKLLDAGSAGSFEWVQRAGGPENDYATALAVNGTAVYVAGSFKQLATFGNVTLTAAGSPLAFPTFDAFMARLTDAGSTSSFAWAQRAGGSGHDQAYGLAASGSQLYAGGGCAPPADFSKLTIPAAAGTSTAFLASLTDATPLAASSPTLPTPSLYPNPAQAAVQLRLPTPAGATQARLTLLNALGQVVRVQQVPLLRTAASTTAELSLLGLMPGLYHVQVQLGTQLTTHQLVVE